GARADEGGRVPPVLVGEVWIAELPGQRARVGGQRAGAEKQDGRGHEGAAGRRGRAQGRAAPGGRPPPRASGAGPRGPPRGRTAPPAAPSPTMPTAASAMKPGAPRLT